MGFLADIASKISESGPTRNPAAGVGTHVVRLEKATHKKLRVGPGTALILTCAIESTTNAQMQIGSLVSIYVDLQSEYAPKDLRQLGLAMLGVPEHDTRVAQILANSADGNGTILSSAIEAATSEAQTLQGALFMIEVTPCVNKKGDASVRTNYRALTPVGRNQEAAQ